MVLAIYVGSKMKKRVLEKLIQQHPRLAFGVFMPMAALLILSGIISWEMHADQKKTAATAQQQAQRVANAEEEKAAAARTRAANEAQAEQIGITYEQYLEARSREYTVYSECRNLIRQQAPWGVKFGDYTIKIYANSLILWGYADITNAYNAKRRSKFFCHHDIASKKTKLVEIN